MVSQFRLDGKVAIITGAGRGLGYAMAKGLAEAGAQVVIADIDKDLAVEAASCLQSLGLPALAVQVDVTNAASVAQMVELTLTSYGRVDILVNNAGINRRNPCVEMDEEDWDSVIDVNLKGTFLCCRAVGQVMMTQGSGKVINISSLLGTVAQPNRGPYAASKGGVVQLTKVLALEWAKHNINVNALGPGYFLTELNQKLMNDAAVFNDLTSRIPMGRWGELEDIIGPIIFLASNASNYITGHVLYADGGYLCL